MSLFEMASFKNIAGKKFGHMTAVKYLGYQRGGGRWECRCDCGTRKDVFGAHLRSGRTRSCGCMTATMIGTAVVRHGHAKTNQVSAEHRIWRGMLTRCSNPNRVGYENYGGRGIAVCERWKKFENFLSDMGCRPSLKHSLDRFPNNDGNYEPGNVRWATRAEQANNRRRRRFFRKPANG